MSPDLKAGVAGAATLPEGSPEKSSLMDMRADFALLAVPAFADGDLAPLFTGITEGVALLTGVTDGGEAFRLAALPLVLGVVSFSSFEDLLGADADRNFWGVAEDDGFAPERR